MLALEAAKVRTAEQSNFAAALVISGLLAVLLDKTAVPAPVIADLEQL